MSILMLLKCDSVAHDDRVRKECESMFKHNLDVTLFAMQKENIKSTTTEYESESQVISVRRISKGLVCGRISKILELLEFFIYSLPMLFKPRRTVWLHDPIFFYYIPLLLILRKVGMLNQIVWDQHELPPLVVENNRFTNWVFRKLMNSVDVLIVANNERGEYIRSRYCANISYSVIRNFVDDSFIQEKSKPIPESVSNWLGGSEYILLQSGAYKERNFISVADAICTEVKHKVVVLGNFDDELKNRLATKYSAFYDHFYFTGMVPTLRIVDYLDRCLFSLILYNKDTPNSELCEPNRFFYAVCRKVPVVCGNNLTMKNLMVNHGGLVLEDDGRDSKKLAYSLKSYISLETKELCIDRSYRYLWRENEDVIESILTKYK
ncbi:hypothetical protein AB4341_16580 [Vibrio breoganii]